MRTLVFFMLFASMFMFGCGEDTDDEMDKDEMVEMLTPAEQAEAAMAKVLERRNELQNNVEDSGDYSTLLDDVETIYQEELGFGETVWIQLLTTWETTLSLLVADGTVDSADLTRYTNFFAAYSNEDGTFIDESFLEFMSAFDGIVTEFVKLSFENPDSSDLEVIGLLDASIKAGDVSIQYPEGH